MEWYQPLHERFARFCKSRAYGDMPYRDLMQETIVVCFQKIDSIKEASFLSYLFGTAIRILANHNKKKKTRFFAGCPGSQRCRPAFQCRRQRRKYRMALYGAS